jgi:hypothetical protein
MQTYALQDRIDTSILSDWSICPPSEEFGFPQPCGRAANAATLRTLYFDTPELSFYHDHHNGKRPRLKVRMRSYLSNGQTFLEVKKKENLLRTSKQRMEIAAVNPVISAVMFDFLKDCGVKNSQWLEATLWNSFQRITLISNDACQRMTIDLGIAFHDSTPMLQLPHLAVVELKQASFSEIQSSCEA